jgi:hypothetical protein
VAFVRVVQMAFDEVVRVVAMGNGLVAAAVAVDVGLLVTAAGVAPVARVRMVGSNLDDVLVDVVLVGVVEMAVVEVIDMVIVLDGHVAATRTVDVRVAGVRFAGHGPGPQSLHSAQLPWRTISCSATVKGRRSDRPTTARSSCSSSNGTRSPHWSHTM